MNQKYLLGIDLGTSSTKSALYSQGGELIADSTLEVPIYYPKPGVVEQENDDFYRTAASTVKDCLAKSGIDPSQVAALAFDSQMAGIGTVDEDFNPATRFDSWLDMRCQPYIELHQPGARRCGHPADRLPADLQPRLQTFVVEGGAAASLRSHRQICHPCGLRGG